MNRVRVVLGFVLLSVVGLYGQPMPCGDNPKMTSVCESACIVCDIDGFTGRHESNSLGQIPDEFCTLILNNAQWIAFMAGSEDLTVELTVSNCVLGSGLEAAFFYADDCGDFRMISNCRGGNDPVHPGTSAIFYSTEKLEIGQIYYLVMDGNFGDNCDWTFRVLEGNTNLSPLATSGIIDGPRIACTDKKWTYKAITPPGATEYKWSINGVYLHNDTDSLGISFLREGSYEICFTASNACSQAPPTCITITGVDVTHTEITETICEGSCYTFGNHEFCESGIYEITLPTADGCDSLVRLTLIEKSPASSTLEINICLGDTLLVGGEAFTQTGTYEKLVMTSDGCDSLIIIDLFTVVCDIEGSADITAPSCNRGSNGSMRFKVTNGTPPFTYSLVRVNSSLIETGQINRLNEEVLIPDLSSGLYSVSIDDLFGNQEIIISHMADPERLSIDLTAKTYGKNHTSCHGFSDGLVEAKISGGLGPYNYTWSNGMAEPAIKSLSAGSYQLTIHDQNGCSAQSSIVLREPDPIEFEALFLNTGCDDGSTGSILLSSGRGGTGDIHFSVNGSDYTLEPSLDDLPAGSYSLTARDANGCLETIDGTIDSPEKPQIILSDNLEMDLGDSLWLEPRLNDVVITHALWTPNEGLSCANCLNPIAQPLNSTDYVFEIFSSDGCKASASLSLSVNKLRQYYAPNIFSPNGDGVNDEFIIMPGKDVKKIHYLKVFNRWGSYVFHAKSQKDKSSGYSWDGTFLGQPVPPGVHTWMAEIEFIDGVKEMYKGNITLIR